MGGERKNLLEVQHLKMWFPITKGAVLKKTIGNIKAVDDVNFTIQEGETLGLVGESGSGKTTIGRCILQFCHPTGGKIIYEGEDITRLKSQRQKGIRREIQTIFQDPYSSLNPRMTIRQIISDPMIVHGLYSSKKERDHKVDELLELVGLSFRVAERYPHQFSGGERQRVGIARGLALNPRFLICDEAVSALDVSIQAQIINLFSELQKRFGLTYLFISHDLAVVRHISHKVAVMYLGHIVEIADREEIYANPLHPYTLALLSAVAIPDPELEEKRNRTLLSGELPSVREERKGCIFRTRCPRGCEACEKAAPSMIQVGEGHFVACHFAADDL